MKHGLVSGKERGKGTVQNTGKEMEHTLMETFQTY